MTEIEYATSYPGQSNPRWVMPKGQYFKFLTADRRAPFNARYRWPDPGVWTRPIPVSELSPCVRGYHVCRPDDIVMWEMFDSPLWVVEVDEVGAVSARDKVVVSRARLLYKVAGWDKRPPLGCTRSRSSKALLDERMAIVTGAVTL